MEAILPWEQVLCLKVVGSNIGNDKWSDILTAVYEEMGYCDHLERHTIAMNW